MSHQWERQPKQAKYAEWDHCNRCGAKRLYSWSPGWPGAEQFFTSNGNFSGPEGAIEPTCDDGPLFRRKP